LDFGILTPLDFGLQGFDPLDFRLWKCCSPTGEARLLGRLLTQELAEQELARSSLVEEGVEWSESEEEVVEEEEEYEEESVDEEEEEFEPEPEFEPGGTT
jgi:hypothetical protein